MRKFRPVVSISLFCFLLICQVAYCDVKLPRLVSDGMVLQRGQDTKIWGWADADEQIKINFLNQTYKTAADANGDWSVTLDELTAGGPYDIRIVADNNIAIENILIGDVWVCSGQSNMELTMDRTKYKYPDVIAQSENPAIRQFLVPDVYNFKGPQKDVSSGRWESVNPKTILGFSAIGYFFAKELNEKYNVPVGLINSALGGSPAEAWLSEDALKQFPHYLKTAEKFKDDNLIKKIEDDDKAAADKWNNTLKGKDAGLKKGQTRWYKTDCNDANWPTMNVPGFWTDTELKNTTGSVWFRKEINVPESMTGQTAKLWLGRIVDGDETYVNGRKVGEFTYEWPPRIYDISETLLKPGKNIIAVRIIGNSGRGGFLPDKKYELVTADGQSIDLKGSWKYKLGAKMPTRPSQTFVRWQPVGLYNAMIAPLLNYRIKGVIWYQGESNAGKAKEYQKLFPALINDWHAKWNQGDFPFLFVQLTSFMEAKDKPSQSGWAELREAQLMTLSVPNTAMVVTTDIGEWNDIHPLNKLDVGKRLALAAENLAYGEKDIVYSGPLYAAMKIEDGKIILSFTNIDGGLVAKDGELKHFAIAGADGKFVWANAKIEGDNVIVWSEQVPNPTDVRYAWADNPGTANLYNKAGLPASPFRTGK